MKTLFDGSICVPLMSFPADTISSLARRKDIPIKKQILVGSILHHLLSSPRSAAVSVQSPFFKCSPFLQNHDNLRLIQIAFWIFSSMCRTFRYIYVTCLIVRYIVPVSEKIFLKISLVSFLLKNYIPRYIFTLVYDIQTPKCIFGHLKLLFFLNKSTAQDE